MPDITSLLRPGMAYSTAEIADLAEVTTATIRQSLIKDLRQGKVIKHVVKRTTYWALKP